MRIILQIILKIIIYCELVLVTTSLTQDLSLKNITILTCMYTIFLVMFSYAKSCDVKYKAERSEQCEKNGKNT